MAVQEKLTGVVPESRATKVLKQVGRVIGSRRFQKIGLAAAVCAVGAVDLKYYIPTYVEPEVRVAAAQACPRPSTESLEMKRQVRDEFLAGRSFPANDLLSASMILGMDDLCKAKEKKMVDDAEFPWKVGGTVAMIAGISAILMQFSANKSD